MAIIDRYRKEARQLLVRRVRREIRIMGRYVRLRPETPLSKVGTIDREWIEAALEGTPARAYKEARDLATMADLVEWGAARTLYGDLDEGVLESMDEETVVALLACPARGVRMETALRMPELRALVRGIPLPVTAGATKPLTPQEEAALARLFHWHRLYREGRASTAATTSSASAADYELVRALLEDGTLIDGSDQVDTVLYAWRAEEDRRELGPIAPRRTAFPA